MMIKYNSEVFQVDVKNTLNHCYSAAIVKSIATRRSYSYIRMYFIALEIKPFESSTYIRKLKFLL